MRKFKKIILVGSIVLTLLLSGGQGMANQSDSEQVPEHIAIVENVRTDTQQVR